MEAFRRQIDDIADLDTLLTYKWPNKPKKGLLRLPIAFEHEKKQEWEKQLNQSFFDCGCENGARWLKVSFWISLILSAAAYYFKIFSVTHAAAVVAFLPILASLVGKWIGLSHARKKLTEVISLLQKNWPLQSQPTIEK